MADMTMKQFLTAVIEMTDKPELVEFAKAKLEKLDEKNSKRRTTLTSAQKATIQVVTSYASSLAKGEVVTSAIVSAALGVTSQRATALLKKGVELGFFAETEPVKGKSGKVKGYARTEAGNHPVDPVETEEVEDSEELGEFEEDEELTDEEWSED